MATETLTFTGLFGGAKKEASGERKFGFGFKIQIFETLAVWIDKITAEIAEQRAANEAVVSKLSPLQLGKAAEHSANQVTDLHSRAVANEDMALMRQAELFFAGLGPTMRGATTAVLYERALAEAQELGIKLDIMDDARYSAHTASRDNLGLAA